MLLAIVLKADEWTPESGLVTVASGGAEAVAQEDRTEVQC